MKDFDLALRKLDRMNLLAEIKRLRTVLHEIVDSRPDEFMDIEKYPELTKWICDTCEKAKKGAFPENGI
jgi:hypothetical protein